MSVEFQEETALPVRPHAPKSGLTQMIMNTGVVTSEQGAKTVLLVSAAVIFACSGFIFVTSKTLSGPPAPVPNASWPTERGISS